ncbi:MAG: hypothetical protein P8178_02540 [Candidatus Thiodiazotropha sp.]
MSVRDIVAFLQALSSDELVRRVALKQAARGPLGDPRGTNSRQ